MFPTWSPNLLLSWISSTKYWLKQDINKNNFSWITSSLEINPFLTSTCLSHTSLATVDLQLLTTEAWWYSKSNVIVPYTIHNVYIRFISSMFSFHAMLLQTLICNDDKCTWRKYLKPSILHLVCQIKSIDLYFLHSTHYLYNRLAGCRLLWKCRP